MAFREVSVVQIKEALRRWLRGEGERPIANGVGVDRKTARRYIAAAIELGLTVTARRPAERGADRPGGRAGPSAPARRSRGSLAEPAGRRGADQGLAQTRPDGDQDWHPARPSWCGGPAQDLARFAVDRCGAGRRTVTVRVDDPPPGQELQVDFGRLGLVPDGERRRVCQGLIFTAASLAISSSGPPSPRRQRR